MLTSNTSFQIDFETNQNYNNYCLTNSHDRFEEDYYENLKNFDIITIDQNILKCYTKKINERIEVISDSGVTMVKVKNIYSNPYAVRKFISKLPHVLNKTNNSSLYPGYVSTCDLISTYELTTIVYSLAETYFSHLSLDIQKENEKRIYSKIPFLTGIYTQKNITSDQYSVITHTDSESGISGVIYLNFPEEYNGGTGFLKRNKETKKIEYIFKNKMEFNSLIMFDSKNFHNIYFDTPDAFSNSYRITQRFFLNEKLS